jgi:hypothetical protein
MKDEASSAAALVQIAPLEDLRMMLDWNAYRKQLALGVKEIG